MRNSDTAINILVDVVRDQSGKQYKMDHYATRYPTNVLDIAKFLVRLAGASLDSREEGGREVWSSLRPFFFLSSSATERTQLPRIMHYSSTEPYTKYEICLILSQILGLPHQHISADDAEPDPSAPVARPKNCQLSTRIVEDHTEGLGMDLDVCILEEWFRGYLSRQ